jgi:hypothetical protein
MCCVVLEGRGLDFDFDWIGKRAQGQALRERVEVVGSMMIGCPDESKDLHHP